MANMAGMYAQLHKCESGADTKRNYFVIPPKDVTLTWNSILHTHLPMRLIENETSA